MDSAGRTINGERELEGEGEEDEKDEDESVFCVCCVVRAKASYVD